MRIEPFDFDAASPSRIQLAFDLQYSNTSPIYAFTLIIADCRA